MKIVSAARKIIFKPEEGAKIVQFPANVILNDYGVNNKTPTIVVRNATEENPSWQGVDHESGWVIVNEVPEEIANMALDIFENGEKTNFALMSALYCLASHGHCDHYTTQNEFVRDNLSPAGRPGIVKRDARDLIDCWQENGSYYVFTDGKRLIEANILVRTYRNPDGSKIDINTIPESAPAGIK